MTFEESIEAVKDLQEKNEMLKEVLVTVIFNFMNREARSLDAEGINCKACIDLKRELVKTQLSDEQKDAINKWSDRIAKVVTIQTEAYKMPAYGGPLSESEAEEFIANFVDHMHKNGHMTPEMESFYPFSDKAKQIFAVLGVDPFACIKEIDANKKLEKETET